MQEFASVNPHDWDTIEPHFNTLRDAELTPGDVPAWLTRWSNLEKIIDEAISVARRAKSEDTTDEAAERTFRHLVEEIQPKAQVAAQALKLKLLAVPGFEPGPEHAELLRHFRNEADLFREANVPIQAELTVLASKYDKIVGAMSVAIDGVELTLQQAEQRLLDPARDIRETAWRTVQSRWLEDRAALDELFLKQLSLRRQLAHNAGLPDYRTFVWREYGRFDYSPDDCLTFHEAIEAEIVPLASHLLETRREQLGVDRLRPWDLEVDPMSRPALQPFMDVAELEAGAARIFERVDPELGAQFARLRNGFLDLGSRKGKAPGGYCDFFPVTGMPYIFLNAVGTHSDVQYLLHEGGHAFHALASSEHHDLIWNHWSPTEFAEVGSMAMELLATPYLEAERGGFYSPEEAARARREHLEGIVQFLPYMAVVDAFQHWVYAEAPLDVAAADLDAKWDELWERFRPGVDWSGLEVERMTGWHRKEHIFTTPFYYIEYGLAQLGALQIWRNALENQAEALRAYRTALALGNTRPLPELFQAAGARLAFDRGTVSELAALVAAHLEESLV
jgi:oligoendopeptidase F